MVRSAASSGPLSGKHALARVCRAQRRRGVAPMSIESRSAMLWEPPRSVVGWHRQGRLSFRSGISN